MRGYGVRTVFLLVLMAGLMMVVGYAIGGTLGLIIFGVLAIALNFFSFWFSDRVIRTAMGAKEVTAQQQPMLHRIVDRAAHEAGMPKPKVYVVDTPRAQCVRHRPQPCSRRRRRHHRDHDHSHRA